jgi:RNA polymerase sigma factor (sigma-70 family)
MAKSSILEIVRRCQSDPNDRDAFDLFYRTFYPYVRLYTRAFRLPHTPLSDEDLIQDIFLKLMEHFPEIRFKNENHFLGYLKAICEHYVIDMVRKYEKQAYEELTQELQLRAPGESPEQAAVNAEWRERLVELIGRSSGTCQNLLRAFLEEGLGLAEIADRQNVPLGTIYPRFSRCVAELRRRVGIAKGSV